MRICAGEPMLFDNTVDHDLMALINHAGDLFDFIIDREQDPDETRLAEVMVERLCDRHGIDMIAEGQRVSDLAYDIGRWLLPEAVELAQRLPQHRRGVAGMRIHDLKRVPQMLSGQEPMPAATVAGELLGRRLAYKCLWLSLDDAAGVTLGGQQALNAALDRTADSGAGSGAGSGAHGDTGTVTSPNQTWKGRLPAYSDPRTGQLIVSPADLRAAGLLIERDRPHGLKPNTSGGILSVLGYTIDRARDHGAHIRGKFDFEAIRPKPHQLGRPDVAKEDYVSFAHVRDVSSDLGIVSQACLWIMRLLGLRIGEAFGIHVADFWREEETNVGYVRLREQGGKQVAVRDPETGIITNASSKEGLKTGGERTIPIIEPAAQLFELLIAVFHTDADGNVRAEARMLPGLDKTDEAGEEAVYRQLTKALELRGIKFTPHGARAAAIDDLERHQLPDRLQYGYFGHTNPRRSIQDRHCLPALKAEDYLPVVEALTADYVAALGDQVPWVPTSIRQRWNADGRSGIDKDLVDQRLFAAGWLIHTGPSDDPMLETADIAVILGCSPRTVLRHMKEGQLTRHDIVRRGKRAYPHARTSDVMRLKAELDLPTIHDVAKSLGMSYSQVWHAIDNLTASAEPGDDTPDSQQADQVTSSTTHSDAAGRDGSLADELTGRAKGTRVRVSAETIERLRADQDHRASVLAAAVTVERASTQLNLPVITVGTLLRTGDLEEIPGPDGRTARYVTRTSLESYAQKLAQRRALCGQSRTSADTPETLIPFKKASRLMRVKRPTLSVLGRSGDVELRTKPGLPHLYVTAQSIFRWAQREGLPDVAQAAAHLLEPGDVRVQSTSPQTKR